MNNHAIYHLAIHPEDNLPKSFMKKLKIDNTSLFLLFYGLGLS